MWAVLRGQLCFHVSLMRISDDHGSFLYLVYRKANIWWICIHIYAFHQLYQLTHFQVFCFWFTVLYSGYTFNQVISKIDCSPLDYYCLTFTKIPAEIWQGTVKQKEENISLSIMLGYTPSLGDLVVLHDENNEINVELIISIIVKYSDRVGEFLKRYHQSISSIVGHSIPTVGEIMCQDCSSNTHMCYCKK